MSNVIEVVGSPIERRERPAPQALMVPADVTPPALLAIAVQQGADIQKLEKLMDLQERWEKNQARKAFEAAIAAAKPKLKPILKNREVDFTTDRGRTNYKYEDFAQVAAQVDPILGEHGLSYRFRPQQSANTLTLTCILSHRDGYQEESSLAADNDKSGNKNSIQAVGSTATYLQRYTLKLALGLAAAKDDDGRGAGSGKPRVSEEQVANLKALLTEVGANEINFLKWLRVDSLSDILAEHYDGCVKAIEAKRNER